jgi:hypothetical protein
MPFQVAVEAKKIWEDHFEETIAVDDQRLSVVVSAILLGMKIGEDRIRHALKEK